MGKKGRAAVYFGIGNPMEIKEYPVPEPEPGAMLIKVSRAVICGSELHIWRGQPDLAAMGAPFPIGLGHEMTGRIARLGQGVSTDSEGQSLAEGDMVVYRYFYPCGNCPACVRGEDAACRLNQRSMYGLSDFAPHFVGAFADYYYLRPNHVVFKVPDGLTEEMVAPANCALSQMIYGLEKVDFSLGETLVIQGAGGLGINAIVVAKEMGAAKVIVIDAIKERLELAKAFGADEVIDINEFKTPKERVGRVKELTGGERADVVAELVGSTQVVPEGIQMLRTGGRYLEIGNVTSGATYEADPSMLVRGNKTVVGISFYGRDTLKKALDLLSRTRDKYPFEKLLSRSYPLEEINQAFEDQDKGLVFRASIVP